MKKIGFITVVLLGFMYSVNAQDISSNAIGLRFGDNDGFGAEISYQHKIKDSNRLEFDLGFRNNKNFDIWKLTGLYQWIWSIDGGFNWYAGFGAGIGNVDVIGFDNDDGIFVNAAGNVGVEYNFEIPLLISLDFRPEFGIVNDFGDDDLGIDIALSLRYQF
jgi:opacity protein-like surface antigen